MASGQFLIPKLIDHIQNPSKPYEIRAAAIRAIGLNSDIYVINVFLSVLEECEPVGSLPKSSDLTREWLTTSPNFTKILQEIRSLTQYYQMRVLILRKLLTHLSKSDQIIALQILKLLKTSFKMENLNLIARKALFIVNANQRRILDKYQFEMNKMKVTFQKMMIKLLGILQNPDTIEFLFLLYLQGTPRLWKDALDALNEFKEEKHLNELIDLYYKHAKTHEDEIFLRRIFVSRNIIPFFLYDTRFNQNLIKRILLEQGAKNLNTLTFLHQNLENSSRKQLIEEILNEIQPILTNSSGLNLLI